MEVGDEPVAVSAAAPTKGKRGISASHTIEIR
jgi:hypothetical protein